MSQNHSPYRWLPGLYIMQGLPFALITAVSLIMYKTFHLNNAKIALLTSLFGLPWLFKPIISPFLENWLDRKTLTLIMQMLMAVLFFAIGQSLSSKHFFVLSGFIFLFAGLISTMHDICTDGLYILNLSKATQAKLIGPRCLFYQAGKLFAQGGLVIFTGYLSKNLSMITAWKWAYYVIALLIFMLATYHLFSIPTEKRQPKKRPVKNTFLTIYKDFLSTPGVSHIIFFTLLYEFPQSQLIKIIPLFLLDTPKQGGLGLNTTQVGILYGSIGIFIMILGISYAGRLIAKYSLKDMFLPLTIMASIMNIAYLFLSPHDSIMIIGFIIALTQFGFGLSNGAYMVYMLHTFGKGKHPMSTFAIGTSLMVFGSIFAGSISGFCQKYLGYTGFYIWILCISLIIIFYVKRLKVEQDARTT